MRTELLRIGNRIVNPLHILHVSYDPYASNPGSVQVWKECVVSFAGDEYEIFYNDEAETVWSYLSSSMNCIRLESKPNHELIN